MPWGPTSLNQTSEPIAASTASIKRQLLTRSTTASMSGPSSRSPGRKATASRTASRAAFVPAAGSREPADPAPARRPRPPDLIHQFLADLGRVPADDRLIHRGRCLRPGLGLTHLGAVADGEELGLVQQRLLEPVEVVLRSQRWHRRVSTR